MYVSETEMDMRMTELAQSNKTRLIEAMQAVMNCLEKAVDPRKATFYRAITAVAGAWEKPFAKAARKAFEIDKREILARLSAAKASAQRQKATINWDAFWLDVREYLLNQSPDMWRSTFVPLIRGLVTEQGAQWASVFGLQFDIIPLDAILWFDKYTLTFADPITQTSERAMAELLQQAQRYGWSIPEMQRAIELMFNQWMTGNISQTDWDFVQERLPAYRTELIARTETIRASNAGSFEIFKGWGVQRHEWLSAVDDRTRDTHLRTNGQVRRVGEPFIVGGYQMLFPGDPSLGAPVSEFANCRCVTIPIIEGI